MSMPVAIRIEGVSKHYPVFTTPWQGLRFLARAVYSGRADPRGIAGSVAALQDVSITVRRGERVGIVGRNGAGKSTLLKLLAGTFTPSSGSMHVDGEIYSLLPGSVGFSLEMSALENARQHVAMLGLPPAGIDAAIEEIREFTELGEYFTQPAKNLSLGMRVRAEFAIATACRAEILVIDEVLGAGDIYWSEKIARRMEQLCARGTTLLLVSHSLSQITRFCDRAIWIECGRIVLDGEAVEVTKRYEGFLERLSWHTEDLDDKTVSVAGESAAHLGDERLPESGQVVTRWPGRGDVVVTGVWINGEPATHAKVRDGKPLSFRITLRAVRPGSFHLRYLFTFWDHRGRRVGVLENDRDAAELAAGDAHEVEVTCAPLALVRGTFHVTLTVSDSEQAASTTAESAIRMDALYKSFHIEVDERAAAADALPLYRIHLELESHA